MKTLLISASFAVAALLPTAAQAQAIPAAVVAVVDLDRITANCNACKSANTALQGQLTAEENREKALSTPLETERNSIQNAVNALNGKDPDAALQARIKAFQAKAQQAQEDVERGRAQLQANQAYIRKQIADKLAPIYSQVMQRRGANVLVEQGQTLATGAALDVTNDVLTALNAALPSVVTVAPAPARTSQPQGR
jgi:Skp family chaperone for outer membrane proteins